MISHLKETKQNTGAAKIGVGEGKWWEMRGSLNSFSASLWAERFLLFWSFTNEASMWIFLIVATLTESPASPVVETALSHLSHQTPAC